MTGHLCLNGLTVAPRTGGAAIVRDVSFSCAAGDAVALVGASGSGKSTIALAVGGLLDGSLEVLSGSAELTCADGKTVDLLALSPKARRQLAGREVGLVFQDPLAALNPIQTIGRQIAEAIAVHERLGHRTMAARIKDALTDVRLDNPERVARSLPGELSGGMRQRALLALALAARPRLLIADEPTTALDVTLQADIIALLRDLGRARGLTILIITHDMGVVSELADRVVVLDRGAVVENGPVNRVFDAPTSAAARMLLAAAPRMPGARSIAEDRPAGAPVMDAEDVSVIYRSGRLGRRQTTVALTKVSFRVHAGEIVGLVGASGSGKTTLGRAILSLAPLAAGHIGFFGTKGQDGLPPAQAVFQDPATSLNPRRRVHTLIAEPLLLHARQPRRAIHDAVKGLMARVDLAEEFASVFPHALSGGQQQRVAIARALALSPRLIVADEALSALDMTVQARILSLFRDIALRDGVAIVLISHDLAVVGEACRRVAVMDKGRIVEFGAPADVFARPKADATKRLLAAIPASHPRHRHGWGTAA
ncbi:MAG: ABC transporter ATP-binding protein [Pseudomonadota bacterium]